MTVLYAAQTPLSDPDRAGQLADEALELAHQLGDRAEEARMVWTIIFIHIRTGVWNSPARTAFTPATLSG